MSHTDIADTLRNLLTGLYVLGLLAGGLALWIVQTVAERGRPPVLGLTPWRPRWLDFALWLWAIVATYVVAGYVARILFGALSPAERHDWATNPALAMPRMTLVEVALVTVQLWAVLTAQSWSPAPVNAGPLPPWRIAVQAARSWLMSYPVVLAAALAWRVALWLPKRWFPDLSLPPQDPLLLLLNAQQTGALAVIVLVMVVVAPINEELLFRAGLYRFLKGRFGLHWALVLTNLLFASAHANVQGFLPLFVLGCLLTRAYERSGNLAVPIGFHMLVNLNTVLLVMFNPDVIKMSS